MQAGIRAVAFDAHQTAFTLALDCVPDYTITDLRDLLEILGIQM